MKRLLASAAAAAVLAVVVPGAASAGAAWTIQPVPMPAKAVHASLAGVSCWSKSGCITVGRFCYRNHCLRGQALAEEWNGSAWSIQALRRPGATWNSSLTGVSCVSARSCIAVGAVSNTPGAVFPNAATAERWNGSAWVLKPVKIPANATQSSLSGVSCTAAAQCTAVGVWNASGTSQPLAERWNGHAWAIQPTPHPAGASLSGLAAVSCATATSCLAVGTIPAGGSTLGTPLAESWDGSTWTIQSIPNPPASTGTLLTGLSCASPTSCVATGYYDTSTVTFQALAEHWDGSTWTIQTIPVSPDTENSQLNAVWCVSAASCTAVGSYTRGVPADVTGRGALAEYWNGTAWRQVQTTHPSGHNLMHGVSCLFPRTCTAVGAIRQSGIGASQKTTPLAEQE